MLFHNVIMLFYINDIVSAQIFPLDLCMKTILTCYITLAHSDSDVTSSDKNAIFVH